MIRRYLTWKARRKLEKLVQQRRNSFEIRDYAKRREAMLRHTRKFATAQPN